MKTILQIEDNFANKTLIERVLERHDYRLLHAPDGETGLDMAEEYEPDLILIDMGLPDLDGQTVVTFLKQIPALANTPIIAITAWPEDKAVEMAERYGCDGCITKPINIKTFPEQLATFFRE
ncbi:MAG TPA: response regulator [Anaerolineae bacterium]|nr:response regulator [Anaerolineae bacterium]